MTDLFKRIFKRPYNLKVTSDPKEGTAVVFLHGVASDSSTWRYVLPHLPQNIRPITIDLLGFGESPKPKWPKYNTKDHTKSVKYTLDKIGIKEPVTIVGHSMGSLIAIELSNQYPKVVKNLVLCGAPLYASGEIDKTVAEYKKTGRYVTNTLFNVYERLVLEEDLTLKGAQRIMKIAPKYNSFTLTKNTWLPFKKSLKNTIMNQNALITLPKQKLPIHFIDGVADVLIISKHQKKLAKKHPNITQESVAGGHLINPLAAKKVVKAILKFN